MKMDKKIKHMKPDKHFLSCCQNCRGKCCKVGGLYITKKEFEGVTEEYKRYFKKHFFGFHVPLGTRCPFLKNDGCILGDNRFLECKLYPFEIAGIDKLILKCECPYAENYNSDKFLKEVLKLLKQYNAKGIFKEEDVISILHNPYLNKL